MTADYFLSRGSHSQAIELLDRMLPTEAITVPALPEVAEELVRV